MSSNLKIVKLIKYKLVCTETHVPVLLLNALILFIIYKYGPNPLS